MIAGYFGVRRGHRTLADMRAERRDRGADAELIVEQRLDVTAPAQHAQEQDVVAINAPCNHIVSDDETAHAWPQVFIAATANVRLSGE
jgi:hypothetical protein